jgi:hypothetical protein
MTLLALPKLLPNLLVLACADCISNMLPSDKPAKADPPTLNMSRRVTPKFLSHKSLPGWPGMQRIDIARSQKIQWKEAGNSKRGWIGNINHN